MLTASFLSPLKDVSPSDLRRSTSAKAALGAPPGALDFQIQVQEKDNWCWAAVAASVTDYYAPLKGTPIVSQSNLAATVGIHDDEPFLLSAALEKLDHLDGELNDGPLSFDDIRTEIQNGKPICCGLAWPDNSEGHYIVIVGCHDDAARDVIVLDPSETSPCCGAFPLEQFASVIGGSWLNTCRTL